jgi:hypothetical protein
MPRAHLRRRFTLPVFAAVGPTALAACGGNGASAVSAKTASTHPAPNPSTPAAEAQTFVAYRAWTAVDTPASKADYQNPAWGPQAPRAGTSSLRRWSRTSAGPGRPEMIMLEPGSC